MILDFLKSYLQSDCDKVCEVQTNNGLFSRKSKLLESRNEAEPFP
jgi:hypothetical protein